MKLRYFVVGFRGQLWKAAQSAIQALWEGTQRAEALGCSDDTELRLVSVVCDDDLIPEKVYLLRLPLFEGAFTPESQLTLYAFSCADCITPRELASYHLDGWPPDFLRQLAVVLDVPLSCLDVPLGVGGPLFLAAALRVTPRQALRYLR